MNIGNNIKQLRLSMNKTQKEVCDICGFKQGYYTGWENNKYMPGADSLIKLADCFGCSVDYILGRESEDGVILLNSEKYTEEEKNLIKCFRKLDRRHQASILGLITELAV